MSVFLLLLAFCADRIFGTSGEAIASSCVQHPTLPDGTVVPIEETLDGYVSLPQCEAIGLVAVYPLKCENGAWYGFTPTKVDADTVHFCVLPEDPVVQSTAEYNLHDLQLFWDRVARENEPVSVGCPSDALGCFKFDEFDQQYNRESEVEFLGFPLDNPSALEYDFHVDKNMREFTFGNGLEGMIMEYGSKVFAVLNADGVQGLRLEIHPCAIGAECEYFLYRAQTQFQAQSLGKVVEDLQSHNRLIEKENDAEGRALQERTDQLVQERLANVPENRRQLSSTKYISVTFLYDPSVTSDGEAWFAAATAIRGFNNALRGRDFLHRAVFNALASMFGRFELLLNAVQPTTRGALRNARSGTCGESPSPPILGVCVREHNNLPARFRSTKPHCLIPQGKLTGSAVGCANKVRGVSEMGHGSTSYIIRHELGHQMNADHDNECRCKVAIFGFCIDTECNLMYPSVGNTYENFFTVGSFRTMSQHAQGL